MNIAEYNLTKESMDQDTRGIYCLDESRTIVYWNKAAESMTGYKAEYMLGKRCFEAGLDHIDDNCNHLCHMMCPLMGTMYDGQSRQATVYLKHKEQYRREVQIQTECLYEGDQVIGAMEYFTCVPQEGQVK